MRKRTVKATAMTILASGCLFQLGCLNVSGLWNSLWRTAPVYLALEYLTDGGITGFDFTDTVNPPAQ